MLQPPRPKALIAALACAVVSVVAAVIESGLLLHTRDNMRRTAETVADTSDEADSFGAVLIFSVVGSMGIMLLIVISIIIAVLGKPVGRVLMFIATALSAGWYTLCGCLFSAAAIAGGQNPDDQLMRHYLEWPHVVAILSGFTGGLLAIVAIICLSQRSVGRYFRGEPPGYSHQ